MSRRQRLRSYTGLKPDVPLVRIKGPEKAKEGWLFAIDIGCDGCCAVGQPTLRAALAPPVRAVPAMSKKAIKMIWRRRGA